MPQPTPPVGIYSGGGGPTQGGQPEAYQVYVGDLDPNVTNHNLL